MLANGITLGYKISGNNYTLLQGLQEVPELGGDAEKVDATTLADSSKVYELGIMDYGDLEFTFKYDNSSANTSYRILRGLAESKTAVDFEQTFVDGTKFRWRAMINIKLGGGAVNGLIIFKITMALQSAITVADPDAALTVTAAKGTTVTATKLTVNRTANAGERFYVKTGAGATAPTVGQVIDAATLGGYVSYVSPATEVTTAAGQTAVVIEVRDIDRMVTAAGTCAVVVGP